MKWISLVILIAAAIAFLFVQKWNKHRLSADELVRYKKARLENWGILNFLIWSLANFIYRIGFDEYKPLGAKTRLIMIFSTLFVLFVPYLLVVQYRIHKADLPKEFVKIDFYLWSGLMAFILAFAIFMFLD
ncbi:MAG TPA: hypothetical protein VEX64_08065 [Pyrinomonadaceae bacterium]|jgi:hypothetical protein|nr:hypothetical protein [Pyrinomonadaceae bacterium]